MSEYYELGSIEHKMTDAILTVCNNGKLYGGRNSVMVVRNIDRYIQTFYSDLKSLDRAKCIVQILENWELDKTANQ